MAMQVGTRTDLVPTVTCSEVTRKFALGLETVCPEIAKKRLLGVVLIQRERSENVDPCKP